MNADPNRPTRPEPPTDPLAGDVSASLERIATTMADPGVTLAHGAMRKATSIRRRRAATAMAGAAAAIAIAVPVAWQAFGPQGGGEVAPANPGVSTTASMPPSTASAPTSSASEPTAEPTAGSQPSPATTQSSAPTLDRVVAQVSGDVTSAHVLPYIVDGEYRGASGTGALGAAPVFEAVLLKDGIAMRTGEAADAAHIEVRSVAGKLLATLPVDGRLVVNAEQTRFALVDSVTRTLHVYDATGTSVSQTALPSGEYVARGFSGDQVAVSLPKGGAADAATLWWNISSRKLSPETSWATDVNDTSDRVLTILSDQAGQTCWAVSTVGSAGPADGKGCLTGSVERLSYDGQAILGQGEDGSIVVVDVAAGQPALGITAGDGLTITDWDYQPATSTAVLAVKDAQGASSLLACTKTGCRTIGPPVTDSAYLIVKQ